MYHQSAMISPLPQEPHCMNGSIRRTLVSVAAAAVCLSLGATGGNAQQPAPTPSIHAKPTRRLILRNATVIYGNAKPPYGPMDIVVDNGVISSITPSSDRTSRSAPGAGDTVIDATGKYVMPGIVNAHMHWHEERQAGLARPHSYERNPF